MSIDNEMWKMQIISQIGKSHAFKFKLEYFDFWNLHLKLLTKLNNCPLIK